MKKSAIITLLFCLSAAIASAQGDVQVKIGGYVGQRIDDCIEHRVTAQDVDHLVEPFRHREEGRYWQSEFWGKWVQGAIGSYRYNQDPELYRIIAESVDAMIATQTEDGYIGNYHPDKQLQRWDIWGRKYTTLGMIAWYDLTGEKKALDAACKVIDHLMTQVGPGLKDISKTAIYRGMPSSSVLEPVVYLYNRTGDKRYLDFAEYIAGQFETPDGAKLISRADVPVAERFPHPEKWWSEENGMKAYEMMSCYEGILELYKVTKNPVYLHAVERTVAHIIEEEINIAGSGSSFECWYYGAARQTLPTYHTMETCVTFTWMQLCNRMLEFTGSPLYADQIEKTMYNALLASMKDDGTQIAKYSPLEGYRTEGEEQCKMHINCCNANGPRAFAMIPQFAYKVTDKNLKINYYGESSAEFSLGRNAVSVTQETEYPKTGDITIGINPKKAAEFTVSLRIPSWSEKVKVSVNGEEVAGIMAGSYLDINRKWNKGDRIEICLDMRAKVVEQNNCQAIVRGPIVMARDTRFNDGFIDETSIIQSAGGYVELTPVESPDFAWMTFTAPMVMGTDLEAKEGPRNIHFCDFASAGNSWDRAVRYKVWLPKTLNVMNVKYETYNQ